MNTLYHIERLTIIFTLLLVLPVLVLIAQSNRDVVYLKNGSVIKGIIIEQTPNKSLKIQTSDGSIFVYDFTDIEKIIKESASSQIKTIQETSTVPTEQIPTKGTFGIIGGMAMPLGDFSATSGNDAGFAKSGFTFGAEYSHPIGNSGFWLTTITYSNNSIDEQEMRRYVGFPSTVSLDIGTYSSICPVTGLGILAPISPDVSIYAIGQIGALFGTTPEVTAKSGSVSVSVTSASGSSFTYSLGAGIKTSKNIGISCRYFSGKPKYKITSSGGGSSTNSEYEQPTSIMQIMAAITF